MGECQAVRLSDTATPIPWRCAVCGFTDSVEVWPPHRSCSSIDFEYVQPDPRERGLGDSVARWLQKLGVSMSAGCGCYKRQTWLNRIWPYQQPQPFAIENPDVLLIFKHGLGDCVQFTVALRHIQRHYPSWNVDVVAEGGKASLFRGLCRAVFVDEAPARHYDLVKHVEWWEPAEVWDDSPSTKSEKFIRQILGIKPYLDLCRYSIAMSEADDRWAVERLSQLATQRADGRFPIVGFHYRGFTSATNKDLDENTVRLMMGVCRERGLTPLVFDWLGTNTLDDDTPIFRETSESSTVAATINRLAAFVGIDSGPGHIAGATDTPTLIVWRYHHPLHYYGLSPNVTHLVRGDHPKHMRGDGLRFFSRHYDYISTEEAMRREAPRALEMLLDGVLTAQRAKGLAYHAGLWVRSDQEPDNMIVRDVYCQDCYDLAGMSEAPARVLDVGAHIGSFAYAARQRWPQAEIACVEPDPAHYAALRENVGGWAAIVEAALHDEPECGLDSSVGSDNSGATRVVPGTGCRGLTLGGILDELGWQEIDILKLDCEGGELHALADPALSRCRFVVGEIHDEAAFQDVVRRHCPDWLLRVRPNPHHPQGLKLFQMRPAPSRQPPNDFQSDAQI